jgi:hypothetical protein
MRKSLLVALLLSSSATMADAVDVQELLPCKPAAVRYCERTGSTMTDLMRCAATLASVSNRVGDQCRNVLRRYGQL